MKILVIVAVLAVMSYGMLWVLSKSPVRHRNLSPERIRALLRTLLSKGREGAILIIEVPSKRRFVQFRVLIHRDGRRSLLFAYPNASWSEPYYRSVIEILAEHGIKYSRVPGEGAVREFLEVEFGQDLSSAEMLASAILRQAYGAVPERDCIGVLQGRFS